jgi:hypothetical protein
MSGREHTFIIEIIIMYMKQYNRAIGTGLVDLVSTGPNFEALSHMLVVKHHISIFEVDGCEYHNLCI